MKTRVFVLYLLLMSIPLSSSVASIQSPEEFIGHPVGADFKLARWETIVDYFYHVAEETDRAIVEEIGRTTENAPFLLATISSPETIEEIGRYKRYQRLLSHPNEIQSGEREQVLEKAKTVVLISCAIHSSEIGSSQLSMELLYQLAVDQDERTREILDNTIILLVPSANPDGINKVIDWYESSLGKPWEGQGMPWLYQKYVGHDNNRDWFMLTQQETRILTRVLYEEWYPCIIYDIHQMGNSGCRFFLPPFFDPINPNVDPIIHESLKIIGGHMATELAENGKKGVLTNAIYDNWWHGGNRTTPYRHNIVGILTEAASPLVASPIFQRKSELSGHTRGLQEYRPQVNFADPWDGGWWRLRDVIDYEEIACYALFNVAARYRDRFNRNYLELGEKAIRLGAEEPPFAYLIPKEQRDFPTAVKMLRILRMGGIEIDVAEDSFIADGVEYGAGTYIAYCAQPYRNHLKDLMEPQEYPDRFLYPGGPAEAPYDVAGWTLPYQMGVNVITVQTTFDAESRRAEIFSIPPVEIRGSGSTYITKNQTTNDFILANRAFREEIPVFVMTEKWGTRKEDYPTGCLLYAPNGSSQENQLREWIEELGLEVARISSSPPKETLAEIPKPRLGLYQPWTANMDEGWTRFVIEQFEFDYTSLHNAEIRAGNLRDRYDAIIIPDMGVDTLINGSKESTTAPQYVGGIGDIGVAAMQDFVDQGGRLLCLDSSCFFAIKHFDLPIKNALSGLKQTEFFCAGSLLRINLNTDSPVAFGMPKKAAAYFSRSYAFDIIKNATREDFDGPAIGKPEIVAVYDKTVTLLSGWIFGEQHLQKKIAALAIPYGSGKIVLYGFRVQHRAQPHGTFRLLFNGILY